MINRFEVYRAHVSEPGRKIDDRGGRGRWHAYWLRCGQADVETIRRQLQRGWYAHFSRGGRIVVAYLDAVYEIVADDRTTWADAIEHGRRQGIPDEELDFVTI